MGCLAACGIDSMLEDSLYLWMWFSWWNVLPNSFEYVAQKFVGMKSNVDTFLPSALAAKDRIPNLCME